MVGIGQDRERQSQLFDKQPVILRYIDTDGQKVDLYIVKEGQVLLQLNQLRRTDASAVMGKKEDCRGFFTVDK